MSNKNLVYKTLSKDLEKTIIHDQQNHILSSSFTDDTAAIRRNPNKNNATLLRPNFMRDTETILHLPFYNRYTDKTQVLSFYNNDDISRRGLHVQLVSHIACNIGRLLGLNCQLIEAIALGHDIGHTPFGHAGERYLSELLFSETGRYFSHNVQSVQVLDKMFNRNISLQVLDGILCHNGEFALSEYYPSKLDNFKDFDEKVEKCYTDLDYMKTISPCTLEGCVVRISDMIAYIGKDRQDAIKAKIIDSTDIFAPNAMGVENAEIINNFIVDIVTHSYGKNYILLSDTAINALKNGKEENYSLIYKTNKVNAEYEDNIKYMFNDLYYRLLTDLKNNNTSSPIYKHHINYIMNSQKFYGKATYCNTEPNQIVTDYIASMTDDYFVDLYQLLFPQSNRKIIYKSYFEDL